MFSRWSFLFMAGMLALIAGTSLSAQVTTYPWTDNIDVSQAQGPTACGPNYTPAGGWSKTGTLWTADANGTSSSGTGPTANGGADHNPGTAGGLYMVIESSCSGTGYPNAQAELISPQFDWSTLTAPIVEFWWHMFGATGHVMHFDLIEQFNSGTDGDLNVTGNVFTSATATFTAAHVGSSIVISGSGAGNDGTYVIAAIVNSTSVSLVTAPAANESGLTFVHSLRTNDVVASWTDNQDLWQIRTVPLASTLVGAGGEQLFNFVIRGVTGTSFDSDMAVDDFRVFQPAADDVGVVSLDTPTTGGSLTATETVTVTIENFGTNTQTSIPVSFAINSGTPVSETWTGSLAPGATTQHTFAATADLSTAGTTYTFDLTTALSGDGQTSNDAIQVAVDHLITISSFPYVEDFEGASASQWTTTGTSSWALGTPAQTVINSAATGSNSWMTGLAANYAPNEDGAVESPAFDLSSFTGADPIVAMHIWWNAEFSWDGAVLQSSIDNKASWQNVGAVGDPTNWYTDNTINGNPGGQGEGWTGRNSTSNGSGGWVTAHHELTGLGGQSGVFFRVAFGSDGSVHDEGVAFDDFFVGTLADLAEIDVKRGTTSIPTGSTVNIGNVNIAGGNLNLSVENLGTFPLRLTGTSPDFVTVTAGANLDSVTVTTQPANVVAGGSPEAVVINIDPTTDGIAFDFDVTITNDDITPAQLASGTDGILTLATSNFSSATANFVAADVGSQIVITGSGAGNDGTYTIATVNSATDVTLTAAPVADEGTLAWSHEVSEASYSFTVTGLAVINGAAEANPATGSSFTGAVNGPFNYAIDPGAALANGTIELTDGESDTITVASITATTTVPTGITAPSIPTPGHPLTLTWTGTADASNAPAVYTWQVTFSDAVNGATVVVDVNITINDVAPTSTLLNASGGDGSSGTPYTGSFVVGDTGATSIDLATITDANTTQTVALNGTPSQTSGPTGGTGFQFTLSAGILTVAPAGALVAADAGVQVFDVVVTDGGANTTTTFSVSLTVSGVSTVMAFTNTSPLAGGTVGTVYGPVTMAVTGATGTVAFSIVNNTSLPAGLTLNGSTGEITGTPTVAGTVTFDVRALDTTANEALTGTFEITINAAGGSSGGGGGGDDGGCSTGGNGHYSWMVLLGLLSAFVVFTRVRGSKA